MAEFLDLNDLIASVAHLEGSSKTPKKTLTTRESNEAWESTFTYTRYVLKIVEHECKCGNGWTEQVGLFLESMPKSGGLRKQSAVHFLAPHHKNLPRHKECEYRKVDFCFSCLSLRDGFIPTPPGSI